MLTFWGVVTVSTVIGGPPTISGLWMFERWRSRRRNRNGECAACGSSWRSTPSGDAYLIQGRLVCEFCAAKARRRMPWHLAMLGIAAGVGTALAIAGAAVPLMLLLPAGSTVVMTLAAVQLMKFANRSAQRRIAAGEFPDMELISADIRAVQGLRV